MKDLFKLPIKFMKEVEEEKDPSILEILSYIFLLYAFMILILYIAEYSLT